MTPQRILVVYHTSSGNTERVAQAIAQALGADLERIREVKPRPVDIKGKGLKNFGNMGRVVFGGFGKKVVDIHPPEHNPAEYDLLILGTPVYASSLPMPTRAYLQAHADDIRQAAFFCTGESPKNKEIFNLMEDALCQAPVAAVAFHAPAIREDDFAAQVDHLIEQLPA